MSGSPSTVRWSVEQVLALAPDAAAQRAAHALAGPGPWRLTGHGRLGETVAEPAGEAGGAGVWGLCQGSGKAPYQVCADLGEPAFRCSCPSRKIPCKHVLGLLLRWAAGEVPAGPAPAWVVEWQADRAARAERARSRRAAATAEPDPETAARRAASAARTVSRRADRVAAGLDELDRWLADQVRRGLAEAIRAGYGNWDAMAARLIDAQAPGAARAVRRLAWVAVTGQPDRLLAELALLRLLVAGHSRLVELPAELAATVRTRVGYPVATDDVLAGPPVRDRWRVIGVRDESDEQLTTRRGWLRGTRTGRPALVLSFAAPGQILADDLVPGRTLDADLCYYPGAAPLRALVAARYAPAAGDDGAAGGVPVAAALREYAEALAADPWLDQWPVLLSGVVPVAAGGRWHLRDAAGDALPLLPGPVPPWRLVAAAGGRPVPVAGEWTPDGLRPLTVWVDGRPVRL